MIEDSSRNTSVAPTFGAASPLGGRDDLLDDLLERVDRGERLVTVTGAAGVGKSRLVWEFLRSSMDGYRTRFHGAKMSGAGDITFSLAL